MAQIWKFLERKNGRAAKNSGSKNCFLVKKRKTKFFQIFLRPI